MKDIKAFNIGTSVSGLPITAMAVGENLRPRTLLVSGLHGDEIEGIALATMLMAHFRNASGNESADFEFLPIANPDGYMLNQRWNARGVDLNRNFATRDWTSVASNPRYPPGPSAGSEPETRAIQDYILRRGFEFVIELHSYKDSVLLPMFYKRNATLENAMQGLSADLKIPIYEEQAEMGYTIAGGIHTWCAENRIQNLTLEVEKGMGQFAIKERYLEFFIKFLANVSGALQSERAKQRYAAG